MLGTLGVTGCEAMSVQDQFFFRLTAIVNSVLMGINMFLRYQKL